MKTSNKNKIYVSILLFIIIMVIILCVNKNVFENFKSTKIEQYEIEKYFKEEYHKPYTYSSKKPDTIFISLASYRDSECTNTLNEIFKKAKNPEKIFVGICEQNKDNDMSCLLDNFMYKDNVRYDNISYKDARGPTFARYITSHLWDGEEFFLQIDSHMRFVPNWDELVKNMYKNIPDKKAILTHYPPSHSQYKDVKNGKLATHTCSSHFLNDFHIISEARGIKSGNSPIITPYASAGFLFGNSDFLFEVPFDPYLPHLFQGEEILLSSRLWTNGWNLYNLPRSVSTHFYDRKKHPHFWDDHKDYNKIQEQSNRRYYYIIKQLKNKDVDDRFLYRVTNYGLGNERSFKDWLNFTGIDIKVKKVKSRCNLKYDLKSKKWIKMN